jgi:ectoine hydroxylase-related dioxygenase (phytanoyl-CoA dioxygenase family)
VIDQESIAQFQEQGFLLVPGFEVGAVCDKMREELELAIAEDKVQTPDVFDAGMVHNCFMRGNYMLRHLESPTLRFATDTLLCQNAIVYAYQSSSLPPGGGRNYGSRTHVDCPRFIDGYRTNLGYILALQPFTLQNGATFVLPGSHKSKDQPTEEYFNANALRVTCNQGDAIFFDGRLYHRAGVNDTSSWRHSITINFCRPFMRTRFDYPRMMLQTGLTLTVNSSARKYLGYDVRMPVSLEEFYRPEADRLYLPNQE